MKEMQAKLFLTLSNFLIPWNVSRVKTRMYSCLKE